MAIRTDKGGIIYDSADIAKGYVYSQENNRGYKEIEFTPIQNTPTEDFLKTDNGFLGRAYRNLMYTKEQNADEALKLGQKLNIPADTILHGGREAIEKARVLASDMDKSASLEDFTKNHPEIESIRYRSESEALDLLKNAESVKSTKGLFDALQQSVWSMNDQIKRSEAGYQLSKETDPKRIEELTKEVERLEKNMDSYRKADDFFTKSISEGTAQFYQMGVQALQGLDVALASAATGAALGALGFGIGAIPGAIAMGRIGFQAGMGNEMYKMSYGSKYLELINKKDSNGKRIYSDEEAREYSMSHALIDAGIEFAATKVGAKAIAAATPKKQLAKMVADVVTGKASTFNKGALVTAKEALKSGLKTGAAELGEEGLQDVNERLQHNFWYKQGDNASYSVMEILTGAGSAMWEAMPAIVGMGMLGGIGGSLKTIKDYRSFAKLSPEERQAVVQAEVNQRANAVVSNLIENAKTNKLATSNPALFEKVVQAQGDKVGLSTVYINAHELIESDNGQVALQELVDKGVVKQEEVTKAIENEMPLEVGLGSFAQAATELEDTTIQEVKNTAYYTEGGVSLETIRKSAEITKQIKERFAGEYQKRKENVKQDIIETHFAEATEEEKEILSVVLDDPYKVKEGFNAHYSALDEEYRETYADEFETLIEGKKQEQKPQWYKDYVEEHHKAPNKNDMRRLALEVNRQQTIESLGDEISPEALAEINNHYDEMEQKLNALETMDKIKGRLYKVADSDVYLRASLSKEGLEVYNLVKEILKGGNHSVAHQARENALLFASHADVMASIISKAGQPKFTAMDYYNQYVDMVVGKSGNGNGFTQPINKDVNLSDQVTVVDVTHLLGSNVKKLKMKDLKNFLRNSFKSIVVSADSKALIGIPVKPNISHIAYNRTPKNRSKSLLHNLEVLSLEELAKHAVLIDSIPNTKKGKNAHKAKVGMYHRFYVPMQVGNNIYVIKIVGEERINNNKNNIVFSPLLIDLYDVKTEKKMSANPVVKHRNQNVTSSSHTISIGDMLKSVKDYNGVDYVDSNGVGNFYPQLAGTNSRTASDEVMEESNSTASDITKTEAFKEWFKGSKAVDEKGNPLVLYHGGADDTWEVYDHTKKANKDDVTMSKNGFIYLTTNQAVAETYIPDGRDTYGKEYESLTEEEQKEADKLELPSNIKLLQRVYIPFGNINKKKYGKNGLTLFVEFDLEGNFTGYGGYSEKGKLEKLDMDYIGEEFKRELGKNKSIFNKKKGFIPNTSSDFATIDIVSVNENGEYNIYEDNSTSISKHGNTHGFNAFSNDVKALLYVQNKKMANARAFYANLKNPFIVDLEGKYDTGVNVVDSEGRKWGKKNESIDEKYAAVQAIEDYAKEHGHDGVIIKNTIDLGANRTIVGVDNYVSDVVIAFDNKQIKSVDNIGSFDGNNPNIYAQTAWHGSPHKFDSFDLGAIGTGEGEQAHGWGLYFAKDKAIAENYRDVLGANSVSIKINNEVYHLNDETEWVNSKTGEALEYQSDLDLALTSLETNKTVERAITDLESTIKKHENKTSETSKHLVIAAKNAIKALKNNSFEVDNAKSLFEVDIPEDNVLLDENKLLSNQSNYIQEKVNKAIGNLEFDKLLQFINKMNLTVSNQYNLLIKEYKDLYSLTIAPKMISTGTRRKTYFKDMLKKEGYDEDNILKLSNDKELVERESEKLKKENKEKIEGIKKKILSEISNAIKKGVISEFNGGKVYATLAETLGGIKNASLYLNEYGIDGITYEGIRDGRCFVVFDDKAIKVIERYNQEQNMGNIRGLTTLLRENRKRLELFDIANFSTFAHECGHVFLEDLQMLANMEGVAPEFKQDWETVKEWTGYIEGASADENRAAHEKFATGFEAYIREGKAPSKGLQQVFRRFKEWLTALYKTATQLGGVPPKEIQDVMARMLATQEEINSWSAAKELDSFENTGLFKSLAEEEQASMQKWLDDIREGAKERILKARMKELSEEGTKAFDENKEAIQVEIERNLVENYPIYQERMKYEQFGLAWLAAQTQYKSVEDLEKAEVERGEGKWHEVVAKKLEQAKEQLDTSSITEEKAREMAEEWLLTSDGQQRLTAEEAKAIKRRTNSEISRKWNLLSNLSKIDVNAENFGEELGKLSDEVEVKEAVKKAKKEGSDNNKLVEVLKADIKANIQQMRALRNLDVGMAEEMMDKAHIALKEMTISQATSFKEYQRKSVTEARLADIAVSKGKMDEAFFYKQQQIYYQAMARAAYDNEKEVEKMRDRLVEQLKRFTRPKSPIRIMPSSRYFYHKVMYELSLSSTSGAEPLGGFKLVDVLNTLDVDAELMGLKSEAQLDKWILDLFEGEKPIPWKKLTLEQFEEIAEILNAIYTRGRQQYEGSRIVNEKGESVSFENAAKEMIEKASKRIKPNPNIPLKEENEKSWADKGADTLAKFALSLIKIETILDRLDDNDPNGVWHRYIYEPINRATKKGKQMLLEATKEFNSIFSIYSSKELFEIRNERLYKVGEVTSLTREQVIMLALNWGTKNNRQRAMESVQADEVTIEKAFNDFLDDNDWEFITRTWKLINSYFDERSAVQERMYGTPMKKEKGITFKIGGRTIEGAYFPIVYDPKLDIAAKGYEVEDMVRSQLSSNAVWGMGLSATKQREGFVKNKTLLLNFSVIPRAIDEAINHISMREAAIDVNRLLHSRELEDYFKYSIGTESLGVLRRWVKDNWQEEIVKLNNLERLVMAFRKNTTLAIMGYRTSTALLNVLNIAPIAKEIGKLNTLYALKGFYKPNPQKIKENYDFVMSKSIFLKERVTNLDRDLQKGMSVDGSSLDYFYGDAKRKNASYAVHLSKEAKGKINNHAYTFIVSTDLMLSMPLWMHVYQNNVNKLLQEGKLSNKQIEEEAISLADRAVRNVFGSGDTKDTAEIQRDKRSIVMFFTPFYSYLNTVFNALAKAGYLALDKKDYGALFNSILYWILLPSIGEALLRASWDDEDDDIESLLKKILLGTVGNVAGTLPIVRDAVALVMYKLMGEYVHNKGNEAIALSVLPKVADAMNAGASDKSDWVDLMRKTSQAGNRIVGFSDTFSDAWWTLVKWSLTDIDATVEDVIYSIIFDKRLKERK